MICSEEWQPVSAGARIDFWDAEIYNLATAYLAGLDTMPRPEEAVELRRKGAQQVTTEQRRRSTWIQRGGGRWLTHRGRWR